MLNSLKKNKTGILLIMITAICMASGQILFKVMSSYDSKFYFLFILAGLGLCCVGGLIMVIAYKYGELSVIHPLNSMSYIFSTILSVVVLEEVLSFQKILGVCIIILGVFFIGGSDD